MVSTKTDVQIDTAGIRAFGVTLLATLAVFATALLSRTAIAHLPPIYDELYHLIPAMSLLDGRGLGVLDGEYERSASFTRLIAMAYDIHGERSAFAGRFLPSAVPGALLVTTVFLWSRVVLGWSVAAIATIFLLFWPNGIEVSQYVRFYSIQGLCFMIGALAIYWAVEGSLISIWRGVLVAIALTLWYYATTLQIITLLGIGATGLWVAAIKGRVWFRLHPRLCAAAITLVAFAILIPLTTSAPVRDLFTHLWTTYQWEPWPPQQDYTFYHRAFRDLYPTFWPLFPFAALIALRVRFAPALFCVILFGITFVFQSFGGLKNIRYLYSTMPFFFVIWAMAITSLAGPLARFMTVQTKASLPAWLENRGSRIVSAAVLILACAFTLGANAAFIRSVGLITGAKQDILLGKVRWEWTDIRERVDPWLAKGAVIVTNEEMRAVQWLGDYDFGLNRPRFSEHQYLFGDVEPFIPDLRTKRPLVPLTEDLRPIVACRRIGIFVSNAPFLDGGLARQFTQLATEVGATVTADRGAGASFLGWRHPDDKNLPDCPDIAGYSPNKGAASRLLSGESHPRNVVSANELR